MLWPRRRPQADSCLYLVCVTTYLPVHLRNPLPATFLTIPLGPITIMPLNSCKRCLFFGKRHPAVDSPHTTKRTPLCLSKTPKSCLSTRPVGPGPTHRFLGLRRPHPLPPQAAGLLRNTEPAPPLPALLGPHRRDPARTLGPPPPGQPLPCASAGTHSPQHLPQSGRDGGPRGPGSTSGPGAEPEVEVKGGRVDVAGVRGTCQGAGGSPGGSRSSEPRAEPRAEPSSRSAGAPLSVLLGVVSAPRARCLLGFSVESRPSAWAPGASAACDSRAPRLQVLLEPQFPGASPAGSFAAYRLPPRSARHPWHCPCLFVLCSHYSSLSKVGVLTY